MKLRTYYLFGLMLWAATACGQTGVAGGATAPARMGGVEGVPFSADVVDEMLQVLPDGNRIRQETHGKMYRDSQGRTRTEDELAPSLPGARRVQIVHIYDPVEQVTITLNPETKTAVVRHFAKQNLRQRRLSPSKTEDLGTKDVEGLTVTGTRQVETIKAGAVGNDKPLLSTTERWVSAELKTTLLLVTNDSRTPERTRRLVNIQRTEPDPALFQIPPDYQVQDGDPR